MLFPAAPIRVVYDPPQKLSFGLVTGYDLQMSAATSYAHNELGKRKFCMMYQDDESGEQTLAGVERKLAELKLSLIEKTKRFVKGMPERLRERGIVGIVPSRFIGKRKSYERNEAR